MRKKIDGVSELFTLNACRQGGMTELEEAEPTDGQGRALSGHKTAQAYRGYAKETMQRALVQLASDMRICWRRSNSNTRAMMQLQFKIQQPASPWRIATLHNCVPHRVHRRRKTKAAQNFQMTGEMNFQMRSEMSERAPLSTANS
jgi:hypothetical protein